MIPEYDVERVMLLFKIRMTEWTLDRYLDNRDVYKVESVCKKSCIKAFSEDYPKEIEEYE